MICGSETTVTQAVTYFGSCSGLKIRGILLERSKSQSLTWQPNSTCWLM